jgi:hypothetical protein
MGWAPAATIERVRVTLANETGAVSMTKPGTKRSRMGAWVVLLLLSASAVWAEAERALPTGEDYGAGLTLEEITPLRDVLSRPELHVDRTLLVKGRIRDVCQKKGCWMMLTDGEAQMRVRFADYGFFVPKDSIGKDAYVEGRVAVEEVSEKEARHYEAEAIDGDPSRVHGPQRVVSFTATGARLVSAE